MLLNKIKKIIGLDIGNHSIKLVSLIKQKNIFTVDRFSIDRIQSNTEQAIAEQIKNYKLAKTPVNISVNGANVLSRYLPYPKMDKNEFKNALGFEAEKHIPFPINEVYLDGFILKDLSDNKMLALIVAAKKKFVDDKLKLVLDLNVTAIDIDAMALVNAFSTFHQEVKETVALLNIGSEISNLCIVEDGIPQFSRDLLVGGNMFTQAIAEGMAIDKESAEKLKCDPSDKQDQVIPSTGAAKFA